MGEHRVVAAGDLGLGGVEASRSFERIGSNRVHRLDPLPHCPEQVANGPASYELAAHDPFAASAATVADEQLDEEQT
ncbi:hypothetical protein ACWKWP_17385, partial [Agromyces soli]